MQRALSSLLLGTLGLVGCARSWRTPPAEEKAADAASGDVSRPQGRGDGSCEAAVVDRVARNDDVRAIVAKRETEHVVSALRTLPPVEIFLFWQVTLFEDPTTHAPLFPFFYVDPRNGALWQRDHFDGNLLPLPADAARAAAVVRTCAIAAK